MRPAIGFGALTLSIMLAPLTAIAQPRAQDRETPPIVVTGERDIEEQVRDFVIAMTPAPQRGNIPRLESDVCPVAIGFTPSQKAAIERRLRAVATAAGMRVEREGCAPNAVFIATADKGEFIRALWRRFPPLFDLLSASDMRRLIRDPGPAAAWQVEHFVTAFGTYYGAPDKEVPRAFDFRFTNARASRIATGTRRAVGGSFLVVEHRGLEWLTTTQLADYAAMRLFAGTNPANVPPNVPTILTVVSAPAESEVPITLTQWDLSFLRAFHAVPTRLFTVAQRGEIAGRMAREVAREDAAGD